MTTALRDPRPITTTPTGPPPRPACFAARLLWLALVAGVVEALLRVGPPTSLHDTAAALDALLPRLVLYGLVGWVVWRFLHRRRWAFWVLLVGIGVIGTASLVVEPATWLMSGPDLGAAVRGLGVAEGGVVLARVTHVVAVLAAVVCLLRPATIRWSHGAA